MSRQAPQVAAAREGIRAQLGAEFSEEIFQKALAKLKRWMRAAYGEVDWSQIDDPAAYVLTYYKETQERPTGRRTFNRGYL